MWLAALIVILFNFKQFYETEVVTILDGEENATSKGGK